MLFPHWFQEWQKRRRARHSITNDRHWDVRDVDFYRFFNALLQLVPSQSVIGFAEGSWPPELREYLKRNVTLVEAPTLETIPAEFSDSIFIPVNENTMSQLTEINDHLAVPEIAIHLAVLSMGHTIVEWYDLPEDPLAIINTIDEDAVARFAKATGGQYESSKAGV